MTSELSFLASLVLRQKIQFHQQVSLVLAKLFRGRYFFRPGILFTSPLLPLPTIILPCKMITMHAQKKEAATFNPLVPTVKNLKIRQFNFKLTLLA